MTRGFLIVFFLTAVLIVALAGFRGEKFHRPPIEVFPDMDRQAKVKYQKGSGFFGNGIGARKAPVGAIPIGFDFPDASRTATGDGFTRPGSYFHSGAIGEFWGDGLPEEIDIADERAARGLLERGRERFNIFCSPCHGESGNGLGVLSQFGVPAPANLRTLEQPDGYIFDVITHGKGNMVARGADVPVADRWAIISYVRVLQLSEKGIDQGTLPREVRDNLPAELQAKP